MPFFYNLNMEDLVNIKDNVKIGLAGKRDLEGDLFIPPGEEKNRPAILIVHGGGWREGDRKQLRDRKSVV